MSRTDEINEYIDKLRDAWLRSPGMSLTQLVTQIAEYDPSGGPGTSRIAVNEVSDSTFFFRMTTYPYLAVDGKIVGSNPRECWRFFESQTERLNSV